MSHFVFVGIDVSSAELVLALPDGHGAHTISSFKTSTAGHTRLINALTSTTELPIRVTLEATGVYHMQLTLALSEHPQCQVMVVNPRKSKHFAHALGQRHKTDGIDNYTIFSDNSVGIRDRIDMEVSQKGVA